MSNPRFVDVHGFAGGLTLGVVQSGGFELVGKKELPGAFGAANMEANRHLLPGPWVTQDAQYRDWEPIEAELVAGNPPCSGFSLLSTKAFRGPNSKINACMHGITEYAAIVKPQIFMFESVQGAYTSGHELMRTLRQKLEDQSGLKYDLTHVLHSAKTVGNPQMRRRYLFVAHRIPFGVEPPTPRWLPTVEDAIGDLSGLKLQWEDQPRGRAGSPWVEETPRVRNPYVDGKMIMPSMVDGHIGIENTNTRRIKYLLDTVPWHEGEAQNVVARRCYEAQRELPEVWSKRVDILEERDWNMGFNQPVRLKRDHISPVCTGAALDVLVHYQEDRNLTHREVCRLMGFPDTWRLEPLRDVKGLRSTYGKGVTVDVGSWIGPWLRASIDGNPGSLRGDLIGDRERLIDVKNSWKTLVLDAA